MIHAVLTNKKTFYFLFAIALLLRFFNEYHFIWVESDYGVIIETAKNFIDGNGFTNASVTVADFSKPVYKPLTLWPVGYAMFLIPFFLIAGNWLAACVFAQCFIVFSFILFSIKMLRVLNAHSLAINLFLLFIAFSPTPFLYCGPTDLLAAVIILISTYIIVNDFKNQKFSYYNIILLSLLSALNCFFRYASIPNLLIIPFFYFLIALISKQRKYFFASVLQLAISSVLVIVFFSLFKIDSSRTGFMTKLLSFNYYWEHLRWFDSFGVKSFLFTRPIDYRLPTDKPTLIMIYRLMLHLISFAFIVMVYFQFINKKNIFGTFKNHNSQPFLSVFTILFLITSLAAIGFMVLQSLTTPYEADAFGPPWMPHLWTFVYATRYFLPVMVFMLLFLFLMLLSEHKYIKHLSSIFFSVALVWSVLFCVYTNYQIYSQSGNGGGAYRKVYPDNYNYYLLLKSESAKNDKVVFTLFDFDKSAPAALLSGAHACRDYSSIIDEKLNAEKCKGYTLFLQMPLQDALNEKEKLFLQHNSAEKVIAGKIKDVYKVKF